MEEQGITEPHSRCRFVHLFNVDKGPMLTIELIVKHVDDKFDECLFAYKWDGDGTATAKEIEKLTKYYRKKSPIIADFVEAQIFS